MESFTCPKSWDWSGGGGALILPELLSNDRSNIPLPPLRLCSPALLSCRHAIVHGAKDAKVCETPGGRDIRADELKGLVHNPKTGTVQMNALRCCP